MQEEILTAIQRAIDLKLYTISDIMDCELVFESLLSRTEKNESAVLKGEILNAVKEILEAGELPKLNPDFSMYEEDGVIQEEKLLEYIQKNVYYISREFDNTNDHVEAIFNVKLIFLNFVELQKKHIEKISHIKIKSFMGESKIGVSKKQVA